MNPNPYDKPDWGFRKGAQSAWRQRQASMNPFSLITEPTAVRRILLAEGLLDLANEIVGDGFAFVPIECPEYWGLVIAEKKPSGNVYWRVITADKRVGAQRMTEVFAECMEKCANKKGLPLYAKLQSTNQN